MIPSASPDTASEPVASEPIAPSAALASARRTLASEMEALRTLDAALANGLGAPFTAAVDVLRGVTGRVMVTGVGKSGHIGRKIAATFASTGTPASFVHASEAAHGDLGMITARDAVLALSWSGESAELRDVIAHCKRFGVPLVAITSGVGSSLATGASHPLVLPKVAEACPMGLAPTSSTTVQLALGDALGVALLEARGFTPSDFGVFHPGGKLGAGLKQVAELMHTGDRLPLVPLGTRIGDAILEMSRQGLGCVVVTRADGMLAGIVTDGDLRRNMRDDLLGQPVEAIMSTSPAHVGPTALLSDALAIMEGKITALLVATPEAGALRPRGIVHMHDLLRAGVA